MAYVLRNSVDDATFEVSLEALKVCEMLGAQVDIDEEDDKEDDKEDILIIHHSTHLVPFLVEFIEYYALHPFHKMEGEETVYNIKLRGPDFSDNIDFENDDREPARWYAEFTTRFGPQFDEKEELKNEGDARWFEVHDELRERAQNVFDMMALASYVQCMPLYQLMHCKLGETAWKGRNAGIFPMIKSRLPVELLIKENTRAAMEKEAKVLGETTEWKDKPFMDVLEHVYRLHLPVSVGGLVEDEGDATME